MFEHASATSLRKTKKKMAPAARDPRPITTRILFLRGGGKAVMLIRSTKPTNLVVVVVVVVLNAVVVVVVVVVVAFVLF